MNYERRPLLSLYLMRLTTYPKTNLQTIHKKSHDLDCFSIFFDLKLSVQHCNMLKNIGGQKEKWEMLDGGSVT